MVTSCQTGAVWLWQVFENSTFKPYKYSIYMLINSGGKIVYVFQQDSLGFVRREAKQENDN